MESDNLPTYRLQFRDGLFAVTARYSDVDNASKVVNNFPLPADQIYLWKIEDSLHLDHCTPI